MHDNTEPVATVSQWQFQLKDALLVLAAASVLLAPTHYFGSAYLTSIAFSLVLVLLCALIYRWTLAGAIVVAGLSLFFGFVSLFVSIPFAFHTFFNLVACVALGAFQVRPKRFAIGLMATMFTVYGLFVYGGIDKVNELKALKLEYPFESLDIRLAFEEHPSPPAMSEPIQLASQVAAELATQDDEFEHQYWGDRSWALQELHEHTARHFARAAGFGYMRMPTVSAEVVRLNPRVPVQLPAPVAIAPFDASNSRLSGLHQTATYNFVDESRAAYVRAKREAAGFESHGVSSFERRWVDKQSDPNWQVTRFELVSLLRHAEPCVYTAASLPDMDKLADVPTRPLNDFEHTALAQLATSKNVVVSSQSDRIEMLGALRAGNKCLECHHGERGKLLGAFSYTLTPLRAGEEPTAKNVINK